MPQAQSRWDTGWAAWWTLIYLLNLPLPLVLGGAVTDRGGKLGMALGVVVLWTVGLAVCAWSDWLRRAAIAGGFMVAITQFCFVLHFHAGVFALSSWSRMTGEGMGIGGPLSEVGGFAVTVMTGQPLMFLALAVGCALCWMFDLWPPAVGDEQGTLE